jgi:hypothetical protein
MVFDHIFHHKLSIKFLGDHSLRPRLGTPSELQLPYPMGAATARRAHSICGPSTVR